MSELIKNLKDVNFMKEFENEYFILRETDSIVHLILKIEILDLNVAKSIIKERLEFANNDYSLLFADVRSVKILKKEARDYLALDEDKKKLIASAFFATSKLTVFLANFYINVNLGKYKTPTKLFTNKLRAIEWLNSFK